MRGVIRRASAVTIALWLVREHNRPAPMPADEAMSAMLRTYWTNFAKTGDPNGAHLPKWPNYTRATPQMLLIATGRTQAGPIVSEDGLKTLDEYFAWYRAGGAAVAPSGD